MTVTIKIACDNAAFSECVGSETARILRELANQIDGMDREELVDCGYNSNINLRDLNGNTVGAFKAR